LKRSSPNYLRFLESVVKALLRERAEETDQLGDFAAGDGTTYSPYNVLELVGQMEAGAADTTWSATRPKPPGETFWWFYGRQFPKWEPEVYPVAVRQKGPWTWEYYNIERGMFFEQTPHGPEFWTPMTKPLPPAGGGGVIPAPAETGP
jgi:hypothetical protein